MINKYYLYKKVLTDDTLTEELKEETIFLDLGLDFPPATKKDLFISRAEIIKYMLTEYIKELENISGKEALSLVEQRDKILRSLNENYAELLIKNGYTFRQVLEGLFEVTLEHINDYEDAEKQLTGKRLISVIVDGNNHNITVDGKRAVIRTEIENNTVTLEKCKEVTEHIRATGHDPEKLEFMLYIYTETKGNEYGDFPEECLLDKKVSYFPKINLMRIWQDGIPIYENNNGIICDDRDALADCLL